MRVLVVTPWLPTAKKPAAGTFTLRDIELLQRDHTVTILHLTDADPGEPAPPGTVRSSYNFRSPSSVRAATRAVQDLLDSHDLVHTMAMSALLPVAAARPTLPWVHTEHFSELVNPNLPWHRKALLRTLSTLYRFPTQTVAVGTELANVLDKHRAEPTTVIGNYVRFPAELHDRPPREDPQLLAVGGLIPRKGPLESVQTLAELHDRGVHATLTWVGTGPLEDKMRTLARHLSVEEFLHLPGFVTPNDLSQYFLDADLFFLPTQAETFGVVFAEALAHGLPVVGAGVGGHIDFLPPEGSRIATSRRPEKLAAATRELLDDPKRLTRTQLSSYAASRFSEERRQTQYADVYTQATR